MRAAHAMAAAAFVVAGAVHAAPRAEIQVGLCGDPAVIAHALDLAPRGPAYETWLFDDPALSLFDRGVRLRLRMLGKHPELTVKIADQDCRTLAPGLLPPREGKCEYDVHGDVIAGAVSLTRRLDTATAAALLSGRRTVAETLSPAQARYLREIVRIDPLPADLRALGPIANRVLATRDGTYDVDESTLPGGQRYVEVSVKVPIARATAAESALQARLTQAGVTPCAEQAGQAAQKLRLLLAK